MYQGYLIKSGKEYKDISTVFATKEIGLEVNWDDDKGIGGIFRRDYDGATYTMTKLADIFNRNCAERLEETLTKILHEAVEWGKKQERIRGNY